MNWHIILTFPKTRFPKVINLARALINNISFTRFMYVYGK